MGKPDPINCRRSDLVGLRRILLTLIGFGPHLALYKLCSQKRYLCTYCSNGPKLVFRIFEVCNLQLVTPNPLLHRSGPVKKRPTFDDMFDYF